MQLDEKKIGIGMIMMVKTNKRFNAICKAVKKNKAKQK